MSGYLGNQHLKKTGTPIEWTQETLVEYNKCANDAIYFSKKYIKIVHVDKGLIPFDMYPYQEEIVNKITNNRRAAVLTARQSGKCVHGDSLIKIRNKTTGEVREMKISDFHNQESVL